MLKIVNNYIAFLLWPDLRSVIKAYRKVQREGDRLFIGGVYEALTKTKLNCGSESLYGFFLGEVQENAEICMRQILLKRLIGRNLNSRILLCMENPNKQLLYPLPAEWVEVLSSKGIKVAKHRAKVLFWCFTVLIAIYDGLRSMQELFARLTSPQSVVLEPYVHFIGLSKNNIPVASVSPASFTIVDWYLSWNGRAPGIISLTHDVIGQPLQKRNGVRVLSAASHLIKLPTLSSRLKHFLWFICALCHAISQALLGRPAGMLLLREAALARRAGRFGHGGTLAKEYLFSCSQHLHRPLWTYVAEKYGSLITMYYYSVSMPFEYRCKLPRPEVGLQSMTWGRVLTFSRSHGDYIRKATNFRVNIEEVPPIQFSDYPALVPAYHRRSIAVFDVTPVRDAERAFLAAPDNYRIAEVGILFLEELYSVLSDGGYNLVWKKKRTSTKIHSKQYMAFAESFRKRSGVIEVHPDVSAARVVEVCSAVISMPFTSTAVIASAAQKPSVFYDPVGELSARDPAAFGLPVMVGTRELKDWLDGLILN